MKKGWFCEYIWSGECTVFFIQSENGSLNFAEKLVPLIACAQTLSAASHLCQPLHQLLA